MTASLTLFAAGSLRRALVPLLETFQQQTGIRVETHFGPAGLLRERIEAGERCSLFASANTAHPQALLAAGSATTVHSFAANHLNLTVRNTPDTANADWLSLLRNTSLRAGTSTPGCDPSGDYTWQLFDNIEVLVPGLGDALKERAQKVVGGRDSVTVPEGEIASLWLIRQNLVDLFIGYAHYAQALAGQKEVRVVAIPPAYNPRCEYQLAVLDDAPEVRQLVAFITGPEGQARLREVGFLPLNGE
ncbi:extracellular solute-binding protein [Yokenella regensburgei]|uniref:extracellular solute-binding protein n=1 Tax=Yokenella regensburgei TaxID=158877 RepID=UPI00143336C0|nr:extracellular solute-binding protein [Yokenella regensburgei]QIU89073.1 solute-binding protein [Yokenella regensburgei]